VASSQPHDLSDGCKIPGLAVSAGDDHGLGICLVLRRRNI